jgi:peptide/nickel transport system substrate-binding protein
LDRRRLLRGAVAAGAGVGALMLAACGGDEEESSGGQVEVGGGAKTTDTEAAKPGGTLRYVLPYDVDTLDPIRTKSFRTQVVGSYAYSRLLKYKHAKGEPATGEVEADAIVKWEQPDPLTLIMTLRDNMKLDQRPPTNGRALTTEDLVLSWEKYQADNVYKTDLSNAASKDAPVTSFKALDEKRIEIKSAFPDAQLIPVLAFAFEVWILPKEAFAGGFDPATTMRGSGAWTLERYQPSVGWSFKKNPNYYDAPQYPLADGIEIPIITDTAQAEAQFKARNVWWGAVPVTDILTVHNGLKDQTRVDLEPPLVTGPSISFSWRENSPFRDKRVRQALSMLIDRDTFIEVFNDLKSFQSAGVKMQSYWTAPYGAGYGPFWLDPKSSEFGPSANNYKLNIDEAKKLLTAAGFPNGLETTMTWAAGSTYGRDWDQRAETLMAMLSRGGVKVNANPVDYSAVWIPQYLRKQGDFDGLAMYPNGGRGDPGQWLGVFLSSAGANNQAGKMFPELDALINKQRQELDRQKRIAVFHDIQRWCAENMPVCPQGGHTDSPSLSWKGLRGPDIYSGWAGNQYSVGVELFPYYWIEDSLRG